MTMKEMGVKYMQKWEEKLYDREEGMEQATRSCLQNLMANLQIPVEEALTILGVPKEDWEKYLQLNQ